MSLSLSLTNALSGLQTNQTALQVVSNNIANVNTEGYSRKVHDQQTRILDGVGSGVETASIVRRVDEFLVASLNRESSSLSELQTRSEFFARVQNLFGSVGTNGSLANDITSLALALEDVANNPEIQALRFTAVAEALNTATAINEFANRVQDLRGEADRQIGNNVDILNTKLQDIADLNSRIGSNLSQGIETGDLEDQRDIAIAAISEILEVTQFNRSNGQVTLLTTDGRNLVSDGTAATLSYNTTGSVTALQNYPTNISGIILNGGDDITLSITSGRLGALIEQRDAELPGLTSQLDQLAASLRDTVNRVHNRGANTPLGSGTAAGDPATLFGTRTIADPSAAISLDSDVTFQILDSNGDPATGPFTLSAGATNANTIVAAIDGYLDSGADFGDAALVGGNLEIKLEPGFRLAILDSGTAANSGDAEITFDADGDATLDTFFGFSNFFGLNDIFQSPELGSSGFTTELQGNQLGISSTLTVREDIRLNPENLSRGILRGTPPDFSLGTGDNEIALQLAAVFNDPIAFPAVANGPSQTTTSLAGYATTILAFNAAEAASAEDALSFQTFFVESLENRALSESGVNLDEELAFLIIYQQAYSASARVVQTTSELFDELLNLT
jgi:flagellar hook-associated protein 1 FlgK